MIRACSTLPVQVNQKGHTHLVWECLMDFSWCPPYFYFEPLFYFSFIFVFSFYLADFLTKDWEHRVVMFFLGILLPQSLNQEDQRLCCWRKTRMTSCRVEKPKIKELRARWHHTPSLRSHHFLVKGIGIGLVESAFYFYFILSLLLLFILLTMKLTDSRAFSDD